MHRTWNHIPQMALPKIQGLFIQAYGAVPPSPLSLEHGAPPFHIIQVAMPGSRT